MGQHRLVRDEEIEWVKAHGGEGSDLIQHVVDADATGKWLQLPLVDVAVLRYHRTAFFRALDEYLVCATTWRKEEGEKLGVQRWGHKQVLTLKSRVSR